MSFKVVGIGEVLWDLFPEGPQLGGAPANFAYHAHALGADAAVVSRVGNDTYGREILERFKKQGLLAGTVQVDEEAPTGTVTVALQDQGVPRFIIHENTAWDRVQVTRAALEVVQEADAICFGTLAQRHAISRLSIQRLLGAACMDALRVCDINLRQKFYSRELVEQSMRMANVLKLNEGELPILAGMFELKGVRRQQIEWLAKTFELRLVALTCGAQGSLLYERGRWSEQPTPPVEVVDTVGAGDAFTAALVMGLLNGMDLDEVHAAASEVASYVCSQAGATPALPANLRNKFRRSTPPEFDAAVRQRRL
jgi:fructokinase